MNDSITFVGPLDPFRATGVQLIQTAKWFIEFGFDLTVRPTSNPYPTKIPQFIRQRIVQKPQRFGWEILFGDGSMAPTPGKNTIYVCSNDARGRTKAQLSALNSAKSVVHGLLGFDPLVFRPAPIQFNGKTIFGTAVSPGHHKLKNVERIISAFRNAFKDRVDVALMIKAYPGFKWSSNDKRIHVMAEHVMPDEAVAQWLIGIHAFISITSDNAPMWRVQSLACGRCLIAPPEDPRTPPSIALPFSMNGKELAHQWINVPQLHIEEAMIRVSRAKGGIVSLVKNAAESVKHFKWIDTAGCLKVIYDTARSTITPSISKAQKRTCIVQLGRFGDIINILPVAKAIHDRDGIKPVMMVAKHFASVLDGVSYVEPHEFSGNFDELEQAAKIARENYTDVLVTQLHGQNVQATQDSFAKESWKLAGFLSHWGKLPLVFDKRDKDREKKLVDSLKTDKPMLLVNLMGTSSPFPFAEELMEDIRFRWDHKFNVVDLSQVRAERIYDLVGLYDEAEFLVTTDTATHHLIRASQHPVPHVSLKASTPSLWHGSPNATEHTISLRYSEAIVRSQDIHEQIELTPSANPLDFKIIHITSDYKCSGDGLRRCNLSKSTWKASYSSSPSWKPLPILNEQLPRVFNDQKRELTYVRDMLNFACLHASGGDMIVMTNSDICFSTKFTEAVLKIEGNTGYAYRRDFDRIDEPVEDEKIKDGADYPGTDVFIMRCSWWRKHGSKFPDMLIGTEAWDPIMRLFMQEFDQPVVLKNLAYHERHDSVWEQPQNRYSLPSQLHNLRLANEYLESRNIDPKQFGIKPVGDRDGTMR